MSCPCWFLSSTLTAHCLCCLYTKAVAMKVESKFEQEHNSHCHQANNVFWCKSITAQQANQLIWH